MNFRLGEDFAFFAVASLGCDVVECRLWCACCGVLVLKLAGG